MVQPYSINSSARATNASATVSPSLFATLRLMTNSKRVGCSMADPLALAFQYLLVETQGRDAIVEPPLHETKHLLKMNICS